MNGGIPRLRAREVISKLRCAGFVFDRQAKGSHEIWIHPRSRRRVVVPNHPGGVPIGTLRQIIRQSGLSVDEFTEL